MQGDTYPKYVPIPTHCVAHFSLFSYGREKCRAGRVTVDVFRGIGVKNAVRVGNVSIYALGKLHILAIPHAPLITYLLVLYLVMVVYKADGSCNCGCF